MIGLSNGAVLQRGTDNCCDIYISEFSGEIYFENNGICRSAEVTNENGRCRLQGIPVGGPYTVIADDERFEDIYVGDVWILGGQSNMEGNGFFRSVEDTKPCSKDIRALYMTREWGAAAHPLHTPWKAADRVHREMAGLEESVVSFKGYGPGIAFAERMKELCRVPQGLICTAHGGSRMIHWSHEKKGLGENSLYGSMLNSVHHAGGRVAGLFWFQGCSEGMSGNDETAREYAQDTIALFKALRAELGQDIPIVMPQISRLAMSVPEQVYRTYSYVRNAQRVMERDVEGLAVVPTVNGGMDDIVHLDADTQDRLGRECADAMEYLRGNRSVLLPIRLAGCSIEKESGLGHTRITVFFDNVSGHLNAFPRPSGFEVSNEPFGGEGIPIFGGFAERNYVVLRLSAGIEDVKSRYLCYGMGLDPFCNVSDSLGRSIPAFGYEKISELIK